MKTQKEKEPMTKQQFIESYAVWIESKTNKAAFHIKDVERMLDKYSDQQNKQLKEALEKLREMLTEIDPEFNQPDINELLK